MAKIEIHDFYCLNCGNHIPIPRKTNKMREKFHRKKLYCPFCRLKINMVEIRNFEEKEQFLEDFRNGVFEDEKKESLDYIGNSRIG